MKLKICPIKRLYRMIAEENVGRCAAIISSAGAINTAKLGTVSFVFRQYDDLDYECPGRSFSQEDAAAFAEFIRGLDGSIDTLFCCCDAGERRSPAVSAAVLRYFGMDDMPVWRNPHYHPNMLVFSMLAEVLGGTVSDEEKDLRFYTNQKAFKDRLANNGSQEM